jgi:hypothetical protein
MFLLPTIFSIIHFLPSSSNLGTAALASVPAVPTFGLEAVVEDIAFFSVGGGGPLGFP